MNSRDILMPSRFLLPVDFAGLNVLAQCRSNFFETRYKVNRICASQILRSNFDVTLYKHPIGAVSGETKCLLCLAAKV